MEIKLLVSRSGVDFSQNAGDVIKVSDDEGLRMIAAGQAEATTKKETAIMRKPINKAAR